MVNTLVIKEKFTMSVHSTRITVKIKPIDESFGVSVWKGKNLFFGTVVSKNDRIEIKKWIRNFINKTPNVKFNLCKK